MSSTIGVDARRGVPTCNDTGKCDEALGGFMSVATNVFLCDWSKYLGCISKEVYYMFLTGIFLWVCVGAYSYLFLYEDVDVYGEYEVVFFLVC